MLRTRLNRRHFLQLGASTSLATMTGPLCAARPVADSATADPPAYSIIPVVGDGKWIWTEPPDKTGYLEPRPFQLQVGIEIQGTGNASAVKATTPVPVEFPEQTVRSVSVRTDGCQAFIRQVSSTAAQLVLSAPSLASHQTVAAAVTMQLTLFKQYQAFSAERFPAAQPDPPQEFRKILAGR